MKPDNALMVIAALLFAATFFVAEQGSWMHALVSGFTFLLGAVHMVAALMVRFKFHERLARLPHSSPKRR